jgi:sugar lactone lactonase YvrE
MYVTQWGAPGCVSGTAAGQFNQPMSLAIDSSGNMFVADYSLRVQKFNNVGTYVTEWSVSSNPYGITVDNSGNVYVAGGANHMIVKYSNTGTYITQWGGAGTAPGQFELYTGPYGVATDSSGNVFVSDPGNFRIQKFNSIGTYITLWPSYTPTPGTGNGQFNSPAGIAIDISNNIYVADSGNYRIQKFDSLNNYITQWGSKGTGNGQFGNALATAPYGVAVDSSGNVYVVDTDNYRIEKFDSTGTYLAQWGSHGTGNGQFNRPGAVAVDSSGNVYVADTNNNRIQKFHP